MSHTPLDIRSRKDLSRRSWLSRLTSQRKSHLPELRRLSYSQRVRAARLRALGNWLGSLAIVGALAGCLFVLIIFAWTTRTLPDPTRLTERTVEQTTTIYDRTGKVILYQLHGDVNRRLIALGDLPEYMKWATITAEDRNFYQHSGFSIRGILRSVFKNVFQGEKVGGSTITQQFVKNAILTNEKTYTRKLKELILSYRIEQKFTKDEILQLYFNEIPYGSIVYGIEAASQTYFGKSAHDLTLGEAAVIAAIPQRPTYFSPYGSHLDQLFERQRYILNSMADLKYVTEEQAEAAKAEKITFRPRSESFLAPHFVMYVRELLADRYGEREAVEGGYKVITTLDAEYQKLAEKAIADHIEQNRSRWNAGNAALVSLDTKTGEILAMVGSADFQDDDIDGQVNVALRPRQPGSSFKPLAYVTAFAKGFTPDTVLFDVETTFKTDSGDYTPHNYDGKEHGPVTMRQALAGSLNIPAVKTLYLAGVDRVLDFAEQLGYSTFRDRSRFGLSLVLGGGEVKLLEHTAAYATFAREGISHSPIAILKIEDADGKVLEEVKPEDTTGTQVMDPEPMRQLTSVLSDNSARAYIFGEKNYLTLPDRPVAAKTGTTNDYHDAWTVGYTPSIATGVWVGNSDNEAMKRGADGSVVAAPIWNQFMRAVTASQPVEAFTAPAENTATKPILRGEAGGATPVKIDKITGKLATEFTPPQLVEEKRFSQLHDILFYVNKDDPQGPPPVDPFADPQFGNWEDGVRQWAERSGYATTGGSAPTEYDDVHTLANRPVITITSPASGSTVTSQPLAVSVTAVAARGVVRVEYSLDGTAIGSNTTAPFSAALPLTNVSSGIHTLTATAYDDVQNTSSASVELNIHL